MKHIIFTVYDQKAKAFITPFFMHNDDLALRIFKECANSEQHMFGKYPTDFILYRIGTFEDTTGGCEIFPIIEQVVSAIELVDKKEINTELFPAKMEIVK